jgi:ribulose-phosphate 3-epimerase
MKIVPSILADNTDDFLMRLKQAESFSDYAQIDLMDGIFVSSRSFPEEAINDIMTSLSFEVHLMVKNPSEFISRIDNPHLKKVIFHFESDVEHTDFINKMKQRGLSVGIAIKPKTEIEEFRVVGEKVDTLLFLTVDPGTYGSPFKPEVLEKIGKTRQVFKDKTIAADGGVSLDNLKSFLDAGVDYVCIGSRIFLSGNPKENYELFIKTLAEMESREVHQ